MPINPHCEDLSVHHALLCLGLRRSPGFAYFTHPSYAIYAIYSKIICHYMSSQLISPRVLSS
jgi:hypothetical protein